MDSLRYSLAKNSLIFQRRSPDRCFLHLLFVIAELAGNPFWVYRELQIPSLVRTKYNLSAGVGDKILGVSEEIFIGKPCMRYGPKIRLSFFYNLPRKGGIIPRLDIWEREKGYVGMEGMKAVLLWGLTHISPLRGKNPSPIFCFFPLLFLHTPPPSFRNLAGVRA